MMGDVKTAVCIVCRSNANMFTGHLDLSATQTVTAGFCGNFHGDAASAASDRWWRSRAEGCRYNGQGCHGKWEEWMGRVIDEDDE